MSENKLFIIVIATACTSFLLPTPLFYLLGAIVLAGVCLELYRYHSKKQTIGKPILFVIAGIGIIFISLLINSLMDFLIIIGAFFLLRGVVVLLLQKQTISTTSISKEKVSSTKPDLINEEILIAYSKLLDKKMEQILHGLSKIEVNTSMNSTHIESVENRIYDVIKHQIKDELQPIVATLDMQQKENGIQTYLDERLNEITSSITELNTSFNQNSITQQEFVFSELEKRLPKNDSSITHKDIESVISEVIKKVKEEKLQFSNVRHIQNEEIRNIFRQGIKSAKHEVNIVSPWLGKWVMYDRFLSLMSDALERGVTIRILYGIGDSSSSPRGNSITTEEIADSIRRKFSKYEKNGTFKMRKTNTHFKLVIMDDEFYMIGSYNFLSFEGNYDYTTRHEGVEYSENKEMIAEYKKKYFNF